MTEPVLGPRSLKQMIATGQLKTIKRVAQITGYNARYLRMRCHAGKMAHKKILGRYYMTPAQVADLIVDVPASKKES